MEDQDFYAVLEIDPSATVEQVRNAYKRLALERHPDHSQHPEATRRMQLLNAAFDVLGSQEKRAEYDLKRAALPTAAPAPPQPVAEPPDAPPESTPAAVNPAVQKKLRREWRTWILNQLKILAAAILYTLLLFAWSLFSGKITPVTVLLLLAPIGYVVVMLFRRLRRPI